MEDMELLLLLIWRYMRMDQLGALVVLELLLC
jgi:hypothetical protein